MKTIIKNKEKIIYISIFILFTIIFFTHSILITWDSTVYLGMSLAIGTKLISSVWLPIRGLSFPLLLRIFEPLNTQNKYLYLIMLYIFYLCMIYIVILIGKKLKIYANQNTKIVYLFYVLFFIIINPYIFLYYHTILTEFVIMTLNMLFVYIMFNWINLDFNNKKKLLIYTFIISILTTFIYHTKQSFLGMIVIEFIIAVILSIIKKFNWKNILYCIITASFCTLTLVLSVNTWHTSMTNIGVGETKKQTEAMANQKLINGINELKNVGNSSNTIIIKDNLIRKPDGKTIFENKEINIKNQKVYEEIKKVLNKESKYTKFTIYEKPNSNIQYVFFTKGNYSLKEQIPLYFKILLTHPDLVLKSYYNGFYRTIWTPGNYHFENELHAQYYFKNGETNILNYEPNYYYTIENLIETPHRSIYDKFEVGLSVIMLFIYRVNQMLIPILLLLSIVFYLIIKKKKEYINLKSGYEMIILLYGMAFGCIMSYIMFGAYIDRYLVPSHIPMFIGNILLIIYTVKFINIKKNQN